MCPWRCRCSPAATILGLAALLLVLAGSYLWALGGTAPPGRIGGSFELTDGDGQQVTDRDFRGRYLLIYFGYTSCPDVCPTTLGAVAAAMQSLGPRARRLQPLFITVDPARDTPTVLKRYVAEFGPDLIGLTGSVAQIRDVERDYRVQSAIRPDPAHGGYTLDHSSVLLLVGPDGRYLAPIPADAPPAEIAARIARFLS